MGATVSTGAVSTGAVPAGAEITIMRAGADHVDRIAEIAESWHPEGRADTELSRDGFLVSDFDQLQYKRLIDEADYAFVAVINDRVVGFLIGYPGEDSALFNDSIGQRLVTRIDPFVVIKQVAVDREYTSYGVATKLYLHIIKTVRGVRLIAATVDTPPNKRSRRFHQRLGFTEIFRLPHPDGRLRTVWRYSTEHVSDELLHAQYAAAVGLYKHEDSLNWVKLQNYLYITVAVAAALGFMLIQSDTRSDAAPLVSALSLAIVLCLIGAITSLAFTIALTSGTVYLKIRKDAVCELEDIYVNRSGVRVVSMLNRRRFLRQSPTTWTLRIVPSIGFLGWMTAGVLLILM